jgi:phosphatidylinositol alpha-mannosyltransferase
MQVGIVCPYDLSQPGGVQAQVTGLARALRAMGDEVLVIGPGLPVGETGVDLGGTLAVPGNRSKAPISVDPRVGKLIRSAAGGLDLIHVHEPLMPTVSLSALRSGPPAVVTFHADPGTISRRLLSLGGSQFARILGRNVKMITAVSATAASVLPPSLEFEVIPNGLDVTSMRLDVDRDVDLVAFLGRDEPRKGVDVLLKAWEIVVSRRPETRLTVMGADRGIVGVDWLGRVEEEVKRGVLNKAAVYVAPNTGGESFGIVLVEAMAAGAAVLASDLPAFRDVGGEAIEYFPIGDTDALAGQLLDLLDDEPRRRAMSSRGQHRAEDFDWVGVAAAYRRVYLAALS